jgi:hypothetical protein
MAIFPAHFSHTSCTESPLYDVCESVLSLTAYFRQCDRESERASSCEKGEGEREVKRKGQLITFRT